MASYDVWIVEWENGEAEYNSYGSASLAVKTLEADGFKHVIMYRLEIPLD